MKKQFVLLAALSVICLSSPAQTKSAKQSAKQKSKDTVATAPKLITFTLTNDQGRNLFQLIHNADSVMAHSHGALSAGDYVEYFGPRWGAYMKLIKDQYIKQTTPPADTTKTKKK